MKVTVFNEGIEGGEVHRRFWWGNMRERDHLEDSVVEVRITLR